jgi:organic radical activating enzyme
MESKQLGIYKPLAVNEIVRLELELTSTCNLKCPLCIRSIIDQPDKNLHRPLEEIIAQLDSMTNLKFVTIAGPISEPTTYPDLFKLIQYLYRRDIEISLYINGDTRKDIYYAKLGVLMRACKGNVYFTICGSTQELHEKYRVNSNRDRVLRRLDIVNRFSNNKGVLTWIVFNYNEQDFHENYQEYKNKYRTEFFHSTPMSEHFQLTSTTISLPSKLRKLYFDNVDRTDFDVGQCPANKTNFVQIAYDGKVNPCSLYRLYGESHCWECSKKNLAVLRNNNIFNVAEPEDEESAINLRLYYDRYDEKK